MRRHSRIVVLLLVTCLVIAVAPAASGASHGLKATFSVVEEPEVVFPGGPVSVADRCGADWPGWIFKGVGEGTLTVGKETYDDVTFSFEHCSRWQVFDPERTTGRFVGKSALGEMIIELPDGVGTLTLGYSGTWVMYDFLFPPVGPPSYTADLHLRYSVEGGDGEFADVSRGRGHLSMTVGTDGPPYGSGRLTGSLK